MFPSIIKRFPFKGMVPAFMVIALTLFPLLASADEDACRETGIYSVNQSQLNSYFTRNGGPCSYWRHHYILTIKPEDTLIIYRDRGCKTEYFLFLNESFIRLRRRPRALPVDECVSGVCANLEPRYHCFGGFRHWRMTLRSLGVGGYSFGGTTG